MVFLERLIRRIVDHIKEKYHKWLLEGRCVPHEVAVHELCGCKQKSCFGRLLPELSIYVSSRTHVILGEVIHEGIGRILGYREEAYRREVEVEGSRLIVCGKPDYYDGDMVAEFKFTLAPGEKLPREQHIMQLKTYMWILGVKRGYIIYLTPRRFMEFEVREAHTDEDLRELFKTWTSPRFKWECELCVFRSLCPIHTA